MRLEPGENVSAMGGNWPSAEGLPPEIHWIRPIEVVRPFGMAFEARRTDGHGQAPEAWEIVAKLRQADVLISQGQSVSDAIPPWA